MAPFVVLTLVIGVAGAWLSARAVTSSLEERFNNRLLESAHIASDAIVRREQDHLEVVRAVAFTQGIGDVTAAADRQGIELLVEPIAGNAAIDYVEVISTEGAVLASAGSMAREDVVSSRTDWAAVARALSGAEDGQGDKFAQLPDTADGLMLVSVGPIFSGDELVGVVMVGTLLEPFLSSSEVDILAEITIYDFDGTPLISTFPKSEEQVEEFGSSGAAIFGESPRGALVQRDTFANRDYSFMYGELVVRGDVVGLYSVALPEDFIFSALAATRWQMSLLVGSGLAAVLLVGWWLTRQLTGPLEKLTFTARAVTEGDLTARTGIRRSDEIGQLASSFDKMTRRVEKQHVGTVRALATAIDARDPYTLGHSVRVGQLAVEIGRKLELQTPVLKHLEVGGYLHDIGKIGIRDHVLLKPGALTAEERAIVERHPTVGLDILQHVDLPLEVIEFVAGHHEKLDGSGYPLGLGADELSVIPRIATVADIYDALSTERPYKPAMSLEQAMDILRRETKAGQLDSEVVSAFEAISRGSPMTQRFVPLTRCSMSRGCRRPRAATVAGGQHDTTESRSDRRTDGTFHPRSCDSQRRRHSGGGPTGVHDACGQHCVAAGGGLLKGSAECRL